MARLIAGLLYRFILERRPYNSVLPAIGFNFSNQSASLYIESRVLRHYASIIAFNESHL